MTDHIDPDAVLIQHETEHPADIEVPSVDPIPVVTVGSVAVEEILPQHVALRTFVLTTDNPYKQLLALDPLRVRATLLALDDDVVLTSSRAQAMSPANLEATLAAPDGAVLPKSFPVSLDTVGEVWATAPTGTYPARVAVYMTRRTL
ncbi:hypothetical protein [Actinomadura violacea]|uniref:Uncharacterized protein n=1 Tax=Actinomadura violacea TaxID=2819934 RepID=A0ABS3RWA7_9ACTN|nr:hypothetical protein [Actinomadura violacea]MBO2460967.1 hypothetical protein [Actinomadura violacea]